MTTLLVRTRSTTAPLRCATCHDDLEPRSRWACPGCATALHAACASTQRRCPTLGCQRALEALTPVVPTRSATSWWRGLGLHALVVLAPGVLAALWPVLLWVASDLARDLSGALGGTSIALPLAWITALLVALLGPFVTGLGVLAPMARDRGLRGNHDLRTGLSALIGFAAGTAGSIAFVLQVVLPKLC